MATNDLSTLLGGMPEFANMMGLLGKFKGKVLTPGTPGKDSSLSDILKSMLTGPTSASLPNRDDPLVQAAGQQAMSLERGRKGRSSTILTGQRGLSGTPPSARRPALRSSTMLGA